MRSETPWRALLAVLGFALCAAGIVAMLRNRSDWTSAVTAMPAMFIIVLGGMFVLAASFYPRFHGVYRARRTTFFIDQAPGQPETKGAETSPDSPQDDRD
jgi:glucan phosphoethanolaminetransferase (alkaline phosphatase superfamily)